MLLPRILAMIFIDSVQLIMFSVTEDDTMYSSSVAGNIHPSDSQMNAITSIFQGHDTIVCLSTGHGKSPIKNWK